MMCSACGETLRTGSARTHYNCSARAGGYYNAGRRPRNSLRSNEYHPRSGYHRPKADITRPQGEYHCEAQPRLAAGPETRRTAAYITRAADFTDRRSISLARRANITAKRSRAALSRAARLFFGDMLL